MDDLLQFCASSNGDRWLLGRDDALEGVVVHQANAASGGAMSRIGIPEFLSGNPETPQHKALLRLIGSLVGDAPATRSETRGHLKSVPNDETSLDLVARAK
jgi:hypothetical protein